MGSGGTSSAIAGGIAVKKNNISTAVPNKLFLNILFIFSSNCYANKKRKKTFQPEMAEKLLAFEI
jgi:hypothetical protein